MKRFRLRLRRPSPALIVALVALFVSLSGTAWAAFTVTSWHIADGTIRSVDVRNGSLGGADIRNGSISSVDVRNGSLSGADLRDGSIGTRDLGTGSVRGVDIADGSVGVADLHADVAAAFGGGIGSLDDLHGLPCTVAGHPGTVQLAVGSLAADGPVTLNCIPSGREAETCDGVDNDLDGAIDEGLAESYPNAVRYCNGVGGTWGGLECDDWPEGEPYWSDTNGVLADGCEDFVAVEETQANGVCDDGLDNDGDGATDLADDGCIEA